MSRARSLNANIVLDRIKETYNLKTDAELARMLDVKPNTLAGYRERNSVPYERIIERCEGLDLNKVFAERDDTLVGLKAAEPAIIYEDRLPIPKGYAAIVQPEEFAKLDPKAVSIVPVYNVELSAGHGRETSNVEIVQYVAFLRHWMRQELKINPDRAFMCYVKGQSMERRLYDGDLVIGELTPVIDRHGMYAVRLGNDLMVKHVQVRGGVVHLISENQLYPPIELEDPDEADFGVIGWIAGRVAHTSKF